MSLTIDNSEYIVEDPNVDILHSISVILISIRSTFSQNDFRPKNQQHDRRRVIVSNGT